MDRSDGSLTQWVVGDHNIFSGTGDVHVTYQLPEATADEWHNLRLFAAKVRSNWVEGVLEPSIGDRPLLEPDPLDHSAELGPAPRDRVLPDGTVRPREPGGSMFDRFTASGRALLLLGDPGSGKTTALLVLCRELLDRIGNDSRSAVPAVLSLSSWNEGHAHFANWVTGELHARYQLRRSIGRDWLSRNRLVLLFDGLDEVSAASRAACAAELDSFTRDFGLAGIVVSCRQREYLELPVRLGLGGVVVLAPLSDAQIDHYLSGLPQRGAAVRRRLETDEELDAMARSPLILAILCATLGVDGSPLEDEPTSRDELFAAYTARMLARKGILERTARRSVLDPLGWLAAEMKARGRQLFSLEDLQPEWLPSRRSRLGYLLISRTAVAAVLSLASLVFAVLSIPAYALEIGFDGGWISQWLLMRAVQALLLTLTGGLAMAALDFFRIERERAKGAATVRKSLPASLAAILPLAVFWWLLSWAVLRSTETIAADFFRLLHDTPSFANYHDVPAAFASAAAASWAWAGLIFGYRRDRRPALREIVPVEQLSWSWKKALKFATWPIGITCAACTVAAFLLPAPQDTPSGYAWWIRLAAGLIAGLLLSLGPGVFAAIAGGLRKAAIGEKVTPNQSIRLSARNGLICGAVAAVVAFLLYTPLSALVAWLTFPEGSWWMSGFIAGIIAATGFAILFGLMFGFLEVILHLSLRWTLHRGGHLPFRLATLLEQAVDLIFMQRSGGSYLFLHRHLRDHFAARHPVP